jgi:hypothetical protein
MEMLSISQQFFVVFSRISAIALLTPHVSVLNGNAPLGLSVMGFTIHKMYVEGFQK